MRGHYNDRSGHLDDLISRKVIAYNTIVDLLKKQNEKEKDSVIFLEDVRKIHIPVGKLTTKQKVGIHGGVCQKLRDLGVKVIDGKIVKLPDYLKIKKKEEKAINESENQN